MTIPALWKALLKGDEIGNYTLLNTETGKYLCLDNKNAKDGVVPIPFSPVGPLPSNLIWNLRMDTTTDWLKQQWPDGGLPYPFDDEGAIALVNRQSLRSVVLEMHTEQTTSEGGTIPAKPLYTVPIVDAFFTADKTTFGFLPVPTEDGNYQLRSDLIKIGDTMLSVSGKTVNNEAENPNSTWIIEKVKPVTESYVIRHLGSSKFLKANTSAEKSEALILTRNAQGYYTIQSKDKKQSLTVKDGRPKADAAVTFAKTAAGSSAQLWELFCTSDGSYQLASAANKSLFLDWDAETGEMALQKGGTSGSQKFEIREPFTAENLEMLLRALVNRILMDELDSSYDLNCDGIINSSDYSLLKRYLS